MLALWLACGGPPRPEAVDVAGRSWALSVDVPFAELDVPPDSRDGRAPSPKVPVLGAWKAAEDDDKGATYETALPVRPRSLFFFKPPEGMKLYDKAGKTVPFRRGAKQAWTFDAATLSVTRPPGSPPPEPGELVLEYPFATAREAAMNRKFADKTAVELVRTRVQDGPDSRAGLLLPAPGKAAFDIEIPPAAELSFSPGLVAPETLDDQPSDGVEERIEVEAGGSVTVVWQSTITAPGFTDARVDLSRWAGQKVRLRFVTSPGATSRFDYAFFGDPVIASRKKSPKRAILVFVDTLRADHLGTYGYRRDTSPSLDQLAKSAAVFEDAHTIAPWTLPSTRTVYTGVQPESWASAATLQGELRKGGFRTAMFAGNVYLSANFQMDRGWGQHHVVNWPIAGDQVDAALRWLDENEGHDSLLLVHFMDCHLPYTEPSAWRSTFAGESPPGLPESFERGDVVASKVPPPILQPYIRDRYDNNVAYLHHELQRLLDRTGSEDVVVYFADHGEEFWDHGGFEHGHATWEELMHVPLVVRAPGVPPGRAKERVSLLDVMPTVLDALGVPVPPGVEGRSLLGLGRGESSEKAFFGGRDLAFGRPLYGPARWGVYHATEKYSTAEGEERLFDVAADPREKQDRLEGAPGDAGQKYRPMLGAALGREVHAGYRIVAGGTAGDPKEDLVVQLKVPGGISAAWVAEDPTDKSKASVSTEGDVATVRWYAHYRGSREVYVVPVAPLAATTPGLVLTLHRPDGTIEDRPIPPDRPPDLGPDRAPLVKASVAGRKITLGFGIAPVPGAGSTDATDPELVDALKAIGYAVGPEDKKEPEDR